jgi:hypothetical protein
MSKNAFEDVLASIIPDGDARKVLEDVAAKYPALRESMLRQSDYSRRMGEIQRREEALQGRAEHADQWDAWYRQNWVPDALGEGMGATKRELEQIQKLKDADARLKEMQQRIELGGEVTFDELNAHLDRKLQETGLARKEDVDRLIAEKASGVEQFMQKNLEGYTHLATRTPVIALKHFKEFGEILDPDSLIEYALKNKKPDLDTAYDDFIKGQRDERAAKQREEELEQVRREEREKVLAERGMSPGSMPDDNGAPDVGPMMKRIMSIQGADGDGDASKAELGRGQLAKHAARNWQGTNG